nr:MAG TPA: hypothetical protein [Caudoviricetes sp.]
MTLHFSSILTIKSCQFRTNCCLFYLAKVLK